MRTFILCHAFNVRGRPLDTVVLQDTGGRLNLPGGPYQDGEMPEIAAQRYLRAIGIEPSLSDICIVGALQYAEETILCCQCPWKGQAILKEPGLTMLPREITASRQVPPAMKVVIPLLRAGMKGWLVTSHENLIGINLGGWQ
jgi:hypothetical protein